MKKWAKRLGIVLAVIVALLLIAVGGAYGASVSKQGQTYEVDAATFEIATDPAVLAEGERLFIARGCGSPDCHAEDGGGHALMQDGPFGTITASNLTEIARDYTAADWDRAVRHGVRRDGTALIFMPAVDFQAMSDRELGMIAGYVRSMPRIERELPTTTLSMLARMIDLADLFEMFPASVVDHAAVSSPDPEPGRTAEYGRYLAALCTGCHGTHFSGGPIPGAPPELGTPPNLTPHDSGLAGWNEAQFRTVLREGRTPNGHEISRAQMPWPTFARMTDDEIGAIWVYLQTVPPLPEGNR
jgi:mono/diheme cytochrome c family protein